MVPDILVAGKGVSGGYAPLAVLMASTTVVEALREAGTPFVAGHTYSQNPVIAAAGLAVLEFIQRHELVRAAEARGAELARGLARLKERHGVLGDVRGMGLLQGVELVRDQRTREPFPVEAGSRLPSPAPASKRAPRCIRARAARTDSWATTPWSRRR